MSTPSNPPPWNRPTLCLGCDAELDVEAQSRWCEDCLTPEPTWPGNLNEDSFGWDPETERPIDR